MHNYDTDEKRGIQFLADRFESGSGSVLQSHLEHLFPSPSRTAAAIQVYLAEGVLVVYEFTTDWERRMLRGVTTYAIAGKVTAVAAGLSNGVTDRKPIVQTDRVRLYSPGAEPQVDGKLVGKLTDKQRAVLIALADNPGIAKDTLGRKSGCGDARGILTRLAKRHPTTWGSVIAFPGSNHSGGYRLL